MKQLFLALLLLPTAPALAVCESKAPWAKGYDYFQTIEVNPRQMVRATEDRVYIWKRPGFENADQSILAVLRPRQKAIKVAETFDRKCDQWVMVHYYEPGYSTPTIGWVLGGLISEAK